MKHDNCYNNNNNIMIHSSRILHDATVNHIKMKKFSILMIVIDYDYNIAGNSHLLFVMTSTTIL